MLRYTDCSGCGLLLVTARAEPAEQSAAAVATRLLRHRLAAAAAIPSERVHKLRLAPAIAAAVRNCVTLPLELVELALCIFHAIIHLETVGRPREASAEDQEALKATGILHGCLRALIDACRILNLFVDGGKC
jgi:hypothetical protein